MGSCLQAGLPDTVEQSAVTEHTTGITIVMTMF